MHVWQRLLMLSTLAVVGALVLCSCGGDSFPEPDFSSTSTLGAIEGFLRDTDTPGNDPVAEAYVWSTPSNVSTTSDSSGYYKLSALDPGWYHITAEDSSERQASGDIYVPPGQTVNLDIDFAYPTPPPNLRQLVYLADPVIIGTKYSWLTNQLGETPSRFQPELIVDLGFIRWNPADAEEVLYSGTGVNNEVFIYDTRTRTPTRITFNTIDEMGADFSPDGTRVVVALDQDLNGHYEIVLMNRDGSGMTTLVDDLDAATGREFDNRWPAWAPDGYSIAFSTRRVELGAPVQHTDYEIATTAVTGGPINELTSDLVDDRDVAWHPNSVRLVWAKYLNLHYQIYTSYAEASATATRLTNNLFEDTSPTFSWDGGLISWVSTDNYDGSNTNNNAEIWVGDWTQGQLANIKHVTAETTAVTHASVEFRPRWVERVP